MSKSEANKYSYEFHPEKSAIISINNTFDFPARFGHEANIKFVLSLEFNDVEKGQPNCITFQDANKIVQFVERCKQNNIELLIVHCTAGVSRSAGICAAIMKATTNDDMSIFGNPKFCPNMTCYRVILEAFMESISEEEIQQKENINIMKWRKENELD